MNKNPKSDFLDKSKKEEMEIMRIWRKTLIKIRDDELVVGDQIKVKLRDGRKYFMTAVERQGDKMLVVFDECVAEKTLVNTEREYAWETCDLRKWLNGEFFSQAFTEKEAESIMIVSLKTECKGGFFGGLFGSKIKETKDHVFLLAADEAEMLFGNESKRKAKATPWAVQNLAYADSENGICWWWLRTPGKKSGCAACVCEGSVNTEGVQIDYSSNSVRPVIRLNLYDYARIIQEETNAQ